MSQPMTIIRLVVITHGNASHKPLMRHNFQIHVTVSSSWTCKMSKGGRKLPIFSFNSIFCILKPSVKRHYSFNEWNKKLMAENWQQIALSAYSWTERGNRYSFHSRYRIRMNSLRNRSFGSSKWVFHSDPTCAWVFILEQSYFLSVESNNKHTEWRGRKTNQRDKKKTKMATALTW